MSAKQKTGEVDAAQAAANAAQFVSQVAAEEIRRSMDIVVQSLINRNVELAVRLRAAEAERDRLADEKVAAPAG